MRRTLRRKAPSIRAYLSRLVLLATDVLLIPLCLWLALSLRLGEWFTAFDEAALVFAVLTVVSIIVFINLGFYHKVVKYESSRALEQIAYGVLISAGVLLVVMLIVDRAELLPRSTFLFYGLIALPVMAISRRVARHLLQDEGHASDGVPVAIYGAGESGRQLVALLQNSPHYRPVAFIDDDPSLQHCKMEGLRVLSPRQLDKKLARLGVQEILLSMPSVSPKARQRVLRRLERLPVHVRTVPDINEIINGQARLDQVKEVDVNDLLGREVVPPDPELLQKCILGKTVLVTGAGGSIGAELCRQVLDLRPRRLILFERSEFALYQIAAELEERQQQLPHPVEVVSLLGSVTNRRRLEQVFSAFDIDTVYHAAAYKHVPLVEHNAVEGLWNNTFGTLCTAQAARKAGVQHFVLISTDKAVRPTNIMGSSKRLAEMVLQAFHAQGEGRTTFSMVRFGNVLGSSGSVVPLFRRQIANGGPVTVTHPRIIRYFMTIHEAVTLVIQAGAMARGGDVFVLDMGKPVRILDLAVQMIHLSGLTVKDDKNPDGDIAIRFTGLRPGEKLYEELLISDNPIATDHPKIMRAKEEMLPWEVLAPLLDEIHKAIDHFDLPRLRELIREAARGYQPKGDIEDLVWKQVVRNETLRPPPDLLH